jgi:Asp-tRNA(Asn)/Glu-tRNA(Gln) amidotransferase A subunit family amidase
MGSDTCGSIRIPSSHNNLVGLRPTKGLSSIAGIVPLSETQDVGGPLARSVPDLAAMLDATIGEDPNDKATHLTGARPDFTQALRTGALNGARIGTLEPLFGGPGDDQDVNRVVRGAVEEMKKAGAIVVPVTMPDLNAQLENVSLIIYEFKEDLRNYLAQSGNPPVHSLQEIVDNGLFHFSLEAGFRRDLETKGRDSDEYRKTMDKRAAVAAQILKVMDEQHLDALLYPTIKRKPARIGDPQGGSNCQLSPTTGFPALSMQAGFTPDGIPAGVELFGRPMDDAKLVTLAYSYEQATHHRRAPALTPALGAAKSISLLTWKASNRGISGEFTFNPVTGDLQYKLAASGFTKDEILATTLHRVVKDKTGPVIALLSRHPFVTLLGTETLSSIDAAKLHSGDLYLQISTRSDISQGIRIPLTPK